ncbi:MULTISPECIES: adenosylcobinamide-GDP ribazoletransferase [unclassified Streptomyces]|uniref:adenosylcobinamide-GDP ribazoletransferase n=1 Tax=unclassified Streptomyces TaxID=2593676 RepID=UPI0022B6ADCB|nr:MULTISPECIES: adenosylcobinamide-GDP ribazoletransferase [unclassified Streptomyces]MCZ7413880.1 adenosylcobinamide-GDP ribazoletransferase [Streptomyces sp. WMMC897]MCZ7430876.1 adenosylcobinamide-GDP ribazoletransferase [Streptomyces sp. WMMC1477]
MNHTPPHRTDGLRFALGTLTVIPVPVRRWDRATARPGMLCAPVAGAVVGLAAGAAGAALTALGTGPLTAAVATVAVPAVLTRGLHLDGLADVADGLGSGRDAEGALTVMKQSDIGPFGVVTLLLVLLGQVAVLAGLYAEGWAEAAWGYAVAATAARTALTLAARRGVPAARPEGLGAVVAGTVPPGPAAGVAGVVTLLAAAAGGTVGGAADALRGAAAVLAGLALAELLLRRCRRRLGGVTGDVFGALAESATTACLLVLALG